MANGKQRLFPKNYGGLAGPVDIYLDYGTGMLSAQVGSTIYAEPSLDELDIAINAAIARGTSVEWHEVMSIAPLATFESNDQVTFRLNIERFWAGLRLDGSWLQAPWTSGSITGPDHRLAHSKALPWPDGTTLPTTRQVGHMSGQVFYLPYDLGQWRSLLHQANELRSLYRRLEQNLPIPSGTELTAASERVLSAASALRRFGLERVGTEMQHITLELELDHASDAYLLLLPDPPTELL